jgi:hypothetical protein
VSQGFEERSTKEPNIKEVRKMRKKYFVGLVLMLGLLVAPVWASGGVQVSSFALGVGDSASVGDYTLELVGVAGGVASYNLYHEGQLVDTFTSNEPSHISRPMHTHAGDDLVRVVTLEVSGTGASVRIAVIPGGAGAAHAPGMVIQSSWAKAPVTVGGQIRAAEWGDATALDITCEGAQAVTAYVKNDGQYLYLAIDDPNQATEGVGGSEMGVYFDDQPTGAHDGAWNAPDCDPYPGEGNYWLTSPAWSLLANAVTTYRGIAAGPTTCAWTYDTRNQGTIGAISWAAGNTQFEMRIDLAASELLASPGDTVGFYFWGADGNTGLWDGEWPCGLSTAMTWDDPAEYGNLVLARGEPEFVPEPGSIILLASGLMGMAGYATLRLRKK